MTKLWRCSLRKFSHHTSIPHTQDLLDFCTQRSLFKRMAWWIPDSTMFFYRPLTSVTNTHTPILSVTQQCRYDIELNALMKKVKGFGIWAHIVVIYIYIYIHLRLIRSMLDTRFSLGNMAKAELIMLFQCIIYYHALMFYGNLRIIDGYLNCIGFESYCNFNFTYLFDY